MYLDKPSGFGNLVHFFVAANPAFDSGWWADMVKVAFFLMVPGFSRFWRVPTGFRGSRRTFRTEEAELFCSFSGSCADLGSNPSAEEHPRLSQRIPQGGFCPWSPGSCPRSPPFPARLPVPDARPASIEGLGNGSDPPSDDKRDDVRAWFSVWINSMWYILG